MEESPVKHKPTSKVIETLHTQIDALKTELESTKTQHDDYKKKYSIASKKNELFVDLLANAKHENDMINALLKRKERRIVDLENQYNELSSTTETLKLENKNMKIRCDGLQELSASSIAEYERLKIAYDALIASQNEYKRHYQKEVTTLTAQLDEFKKKSQENFANLQTSLSSNDKDVDALLDSLTNKRKTMDNLNVSKNKAILELVSKLAKTAIAHGQESKAILQQNVEVISGLVEKHPDLSDKITEHEKVEIDLDDILGDATETLLNSSFDEEATLVASPDPSVDASKQWQNGPSRQASMKRRKNKRNSMRFDSGAGASFASLQSPTQLSIPKRSGSNPNSPSLNGRVSTPPEDLYKHTYNQLNYNSSANPSYASHSRSGSVNNFHQSNRYRNSSQASTAQKRGNRRSMYGGSGQGQYRGGHSRQNSTQYEPVYTN